MHLSELDRLKIEQYLSGIKKANKYIVSKLNIKEISEVLNKSRSSIYREIKRNRIFKIFTNNISLKKEKILKIENIKEHICPEISNEIYLICNMCPKYFECKISQKLIYDGKIAQYMTDRKKKITRQGKGNIKKNNQELLNKIQKGLTLGQPIHHIVVSLNF